MQAHAVRARTAARRSGEPDLRLSAAPPSARRRAIPAFVTRYFHRFVPDRPIVLHEQAVANRGSPHRRWVGDRNRCRPPPVPRGSCSLLRGSRPVERAYRGRAPRQCGSVRLSAHAATAPMTWGAGVQCWGRPPQRRRRVRAQKRHDLHIWISFRKAHQARGRETRDPPSDCVYWRTRCAGAHSRRSGHGRRTVRCTRDEAACPGARKTHPTPLGSVLTTASASARISRNLPDWNSSRRRR